MQTLNRLLGLGMHPDDVALWWQRLGSRTIHRVLMHDEVVPWWEELGVHRHPIPTVVSAIEGVARIGLGPRTHVDLLPGEAMWIAPWTWHSQLRPIHGVAVSIGWSPKQGDVVFYQAGAWWEGRVDHDLVASVLSRLARSDEAERCAAITRLHAAISNQPPEPTLMSPPLRAMCEAVWKHRTAPITAAKVMAASGLGSTAAYQLFATWFGEAPKQHLLRCRLDLACHLLERGWPPGRVWRECGFDSRANFTRRFRLVHGVPPSEWVPQGR